MSTTTDVAPVPTVRSDWLQVGSVVGIIFGVVVGLLASVGGIMPEIGAVIGMPTLVGGWILHMTLALVTSIGFAAALSTSRLSQYARQLRTLVPMGLAFGVLMWLVLDALVLAYLSVAFDAPGAVFPNFAVEDAIVTLVFGVLIALTYYGTRRWLIKGSAVAQ